jgi:hypothetical protein
MNKKPNKNTVKKIKVFFANQQANDTQTSNKKNRGNSQRSQSN